MINLRFRKALSRCGSCNCRSYVKIAVKTDVWIVANDMNNCLLKLIVIHYEADTRWHHGSDKRGEAHFKISLSTFNINSSAWSVNVFYPSRYAHLLTMQSGFGNMADRVDRETGGFEAEFVSPLPQEYECPICQLAFRDPVQIEDCGHRFCQSCLQELKRR